MAETRAGAPCFSGSCSEVYLEKPLMEHRGPSFEQRLVNAKKVRESKFNVLGASDFVEHNMQKTVDAFKQVISQIPCGKRIFGLCNFCLHLTRLTHLEDIIRVIASLLRRQNKLFWWSWISVFYL